MYKDSDEAYGRALHVQARTSARFRSASKLLSHIKRFGLNYYVGKISRFHILGVKMKFLRSPRVVEKLSLLTIIVDFPHIGHRECHKEQFRTATEISPSFMSKSFKLHGAI